jgi:hypothetical protein
MKTKILKLIVITAMLLTIATAVLGAPAGLTISSNTTDYGRTIFPANRSDPGGTITTLQWTQHNRTHNGKRM